VAAIGIEVPLLIEARHPVLIRRLDHQRVALETSPRVALPEQDVLADVRTTIEGNHPNGIGLLRQHHDLCRCLQELIGAHVEMTRNT
jgi:hypothetical protein